MKGLDLTSFSFNSVIKLFCLISGCLTNITLLMPKSNFINSLWSWSTCLETSLGLIVIQQMTYFLRHSIGIATSHFCKLSSCSCETWKLKARKYKSVYCQYNKSSQVFRSLCACVQFQNSSWWFKHFQIFYNVLTEIEGDPTL